MGFGKDGKGAIVRQNLSLPLLTLASGDALKFPALTMGEDFRILKSEIYAHVATLTAGEGQGLLFGIANGELTNAEIAAALVTNGPTDINDRSLQESAERNVKLLSSGILIDSAGIQRHLLGAEGGPMIVSKHRWTYSNPEGWSWFIFNDGPTLTTGATARMVATNFGMWVQ